MKNEIFIFLLGKLGNVSEAEEVMVKSFFKLWKERAKLTKNEDIRRFIYTYAKQISIEMFRSRKRRRRRNVRYDERYLENIPVDETVDPMDELDAKVLEGYLDAILMAMESLPSQYKEVFRLNYIEHRSMKDIAAMLGIKLDKAYQYRARAIRRIRKELRRTGRWISLGFFLLWIHFF